MADPAAALPSTAHTALLYINHTKQPPYVDQYWNLETEQTMNQYVPKRELRSEAKAEEIGNDGGWD